jgi:hypothetical protein
MVDFYKIDKNGKLTKVQSYGFTDEPSDMQQFMVKNIQILGNVVILDQFYDTREAGIMDIVGLDIDEKRVQIVELKNLPVDEKVIPQILKYAFWAKENPEYFRNKVVQKMEKELKEIIRDEREINYDPKIVLVAPSFSSQLLKQSQLLNVDVSFIEISRYKSADDLFVTVDYKEVEEAKRALPRGRQDWDWEKYRRELEISTEAMEIGQMMEKQIDALISNKGWDLKKSFIKGCIVYKHGWRNVFIIHPGYWVTKDCWIAFKLSEEPKKEDLSLLLTDMKTKWYPEYHDWYVRITRKDFEVTKLQPIFEKAYSYVTSQ